MSSTDLHQVVFKWPHTEPTTVIVTGTFDEWKSSIRLVKNQTGFEGVTQIPWEQKIKFKFIVDGDWLVHEDQPTEVDPGGYVNNIYTAPAKPVILPALETTPLPIEAETAAEAINHKTNGDTMVAEVAEKPEYTPQTLPKHTKSLTGTTDAKIAEQKTTDTQTSGFLADLASTIAARDGTSSALAYVASGLGAAMHSAVGIDPINIPKISIPTPKYNDDFTLPPGMAIKSPTIMEESAFELSPSPIAPLVPIMIVPVNAAENNTVASSPPPESMHILPRFTAESSVPDTKDVPDVAVTEKVAADTPVVVNALPVPEVVIKAADPVVAPVSDIVPEEKANGPSPDPAVVNTPHITESVVEENIATDAEVTTVIEVPAEKTIESSPAPVIDTLPMPDPAIKESASAEAESIPVIDVIPLESEAPAEKFPEPGTGQPLDEAFSIAVVETKPEDSSALEPTEAAPVLEEPLAEPAAAESVIERTPIPVIDVPVDVVELPVTEDYPAVNEPTVEATDLPVNFETPKAPAAPVPEEPPAKPTAADIVVERTPVHVIEVPIDVVELPVTENYPTVDKPTVDATDLPVIFETPTAPATAANTEIEPVSTSPVIPAATEAPEAPVPSDLMSSLPVVVFEESMTETEPVVAEVIPPIEPILVIEEKAQTPISVPEVKDVQTTEASPSSNEHTETSAIAPESRIVNAAIVTEGGVVEPIPTPQTTEDSVPDTNGHFTHSVPTTPRKEMSTTGSVKGIHDFPSSQTSSPSQTADSSPSSSKFNSARKKRTSIFGKIKNIFHHDKEKEKK